MVDSEKLGDFRQLTYLESTSRCSGKVTIQKLPLTSSSFDLQLGRGILGLLQYSQLAEFAQRWDGGEG